MGEFRHLHLAQEDGLWWLELDVADETNNALSPEVLDELAAACSSIRVQQPKGLVICSAKPAGFSVGINLKLLPLIKTSTQVLELAQKGQAVCQAFADLTCPTLAMIDGFCIGGGLELALALDYRIATDQPTTRLGLPEVKLGIHPGFGGSVRSITRIGVLHAMDIMLSGRLVGAPEALEMGLIDRCLPAGQLRQTAIQMLLKPPTQYKPPLHLNAINQLAPARSLLAAKLRRQVAKNASPEHYPAPYALINLWEKYGGNTTAMYREEALSVARLITGETARNLVRVFFLQNRLKALGNKSTCQVHHVHVVGCGNTGKDIAAWCAMQGMQVSVQDNNANALAQLVPNATMRLQQHYLKDHQAIQTVLARLYPDPDGTQIGKADVIIESIFEDLQAKRRLFAKLEQYAKAEAILATNTSCIPLEDIAGALREPQRLIGLHFPNPVFSMLLVEVAYDPHTRDKAIMERALAFIRHINKLPLPVHSTPGFLVNRVLMPYLLEGIRLQQQGVPTSIVDAAARDFGMSLGPLELADNIGLDICQQVADILARKLHLDVPLTLHHMVRAGKLGRKNGEGFYHYRHGKIMKPTQTIEWQGNREALQTRLITPLIREAKDCLAQGIVGNTDLLDAGILFGAGFPAFRGGPLQHNAQH